MQWCYEKIELLINFSSQSTFLFSVKLSDYHIRMKRASSRSSAIINFDAINRLHLARKKLAPESGVEFMAPVSGAYFWSRVYEALGRRESRISPPECYSA